MLEFINKLLAELTGFDFWFAAILIVIGLAGWYYFGQSKKAEQQIAKRQFRFVGLITVIGIFGIAVHHLFFEPNYTFPNGVAGILVLRIEGDDEKNSLQRDLVSALNNRLSKETFEQKIEVLAYNETAAENIGLSKAHVKARKIGKENKAILVIWGNRIGERKFYPRLTIVDDEPSALIKGDRLLEVQSININEVSLPPELVNQPVYLTYFLIGFSFFDQEDYPKALMHFEKALTLQVDNPTEVNDIRIFAGFSHWNLAQGQRKMELHLKQAITYYNTVLDFYKPSNFTPQWAITQANLGLAFLDLPNFALNQNIQKAIAAFESALLVLTEKDFPVYWAMIQNNWGCAYLRLPTGDHNANLQKAIVAFEATLRVVTEKNSPAEWGGIQNNLCNAYLRLTTGDRNANLQKAIAAIELALRVLTENDFPMQWAKTQINLGKVYRDLFDGDRNSNLLKAINANDAALRIFTYNNFPVDWATAQGNLGVAYANLSIGDPEENLLKAITAYQMALSIHTEQDFPVDWAKIQNNLGVAYTKLPTGDHITNLLNAIDAHKAALRVYTEKDFPLDWALTQFNLGSAYLTISNQIDNLEKAISCFENTLRIWTEEAFPNDHRKVTQNLKHAQNGLNSLLQARRMQK